MPSPRFEVYTPKSGEVTVLKSSKYETQKEIEYLKDIRGACIVKFNDTNSINDALRLVGYSIYSLRPEDENEIDRSVVDFVVKHVDGSPWGKVNYLDDSGANQILEVIDDDGEVIFVPFSEGIVVDIDREKRIITIDPPDGLKDLNK
jgi:ribosomal 30S subunit maturation factor RimM